MFSGQAIINLAIPLTTSYKKGINFFHPRMKRLRLILPFLLGVLPVSGVPAAAATTDATANGFASVEKLKAGKYEWKTEEPSKSVTGRTAILVSLSRQMLYVYRGGTLIARSSISSGRPGRSTPSGSYRVRGKEEMHYSNLYDNAPMPFMQRLTDDGVALHAGRVASEPSSHGCIRLPSDFAKKLFGVTACGDPVLVVSSDEGVVKGSGGEMPEVLSEVLKECASTTIPSNGTPPNSPPLIPPNPVVSPKFVSSVQTATNVLTSTKTLRELEVEELSIRNDPALDSESRHRELLRIWAQQSGLMKQQ